MDKGMAGASDGFAVHCVDSAEDLHFFREQAVKAGWRPGIHDMEAFYASDPSGFFIGELDGTRISCIFVVKHNEKFSFVDYYIVDEAYRGRGFGIRTFRAGMASIAGARSNMALDAVLKVVPLYEKSGFVHRGWNLGQYLIQSLKVVHAFSDVNPVAQSHHSIVIKLIIEVEFEKLTAFDHSIVQFQRRSFLEKWISAESALGWAAVTQTGEVLGYTVVRKTLCRSDQQHARKLGPLFAESVSIAKALLCTAAQAVSAEAPEEKLVVDIPLEGNPGAVEIIQEVEGEGDIRCKRLFTKQALQYPEEKIFGVVV